MIESGAKYQARTKSIRIASVSGEMAIDEFVIGIAALDTHIVFEAFECLFLERLFPKFSKIYG
jgi:hypothetical protein